MADRHLLGRHTPLDEPPPGPTGHLAAVPVLAGCSPCRLKTRLFRRGRTTFTSSTWTGYRTAAEDPGPCHPLCQDRTGGGYRDRGAPPPAIIARCRRRRPTSY